MSVRQEEVSNSSQEASLVQEDMDDESVDLIEEAAETYCEDKSAENDEDVAQMDEEDSNETETNNGDSSNDDRTGQVTPKPNRELKSILALSKEARLDTNIAHKRKSVEPGGKQVEKSESTMKRRNSTGSNSDGHKVERKSIKVQNSDLQGKQQKMCDVESQSGISDNEDNKETKEKDGLNSKVNKRKRDSLADLSTGGAADEHGKRNRKLSSNLIITMNNKKKDPFCWRCHHEGAAVYCETCPRAFHQKCLKQNVSQPNHWLCPECVTILKAENLKQRSPAMRDMSLEHLCGLLKFALKRMLQVGGCEPFIHPVSENEFPEYKSYIVQPMDLTCLERNIKDNVYGSTQAFEADAKWILHNSIIFNSYQSKLTSIAKSILKICKQEMSEIENCASCYLNANTKKKTWFVEVCPKPHLLVWAKLKGFPYWPAKAMRTNSQGFVDVRFFGAHDRAWVSFKECFLYSLKDPNSSKVKRNDINESVKELNVHIENLKKVYGEFRYAPYRVIFEPEEELRQLRYMLPKYDPEAKTQPKLGSKSANKHSTNGSISPDDLESDSEKSQSDSDTSEAKSSTISRKDKDTGDSGAEDEELETDEGLEQDISNRVDTPKSGNKQNELVEKTSDLNKTDTDENKSEGSENFCSSTLGDSGVFINNPVRGGKVRMRGGYTNTSGKIKVIPKLVSPENESKKRPPCDDAEVPSKLSRRNSDQSIKSNSSRLSNISDKISKVDISENVEISLGNDSSGSLSISENISSSNEFSKINLPEVTIEAKRKPVVQVNISANENAEFTISPHSKSRIADRLMKKLTEPVENDVKITKIEAVKKQISDDHDEPEKCFVNLNQNITETDLLLEKFKNKGLTVLEKITELSPDMEIFETNAELEKNKVEPVSSTETSSEINPQERNGKDSDSTPSITKEIKSVCSTLEKSMSASDEQNSNDSVEISSSDDESSENSDVSSKRENEPVSNVDNKSASSPLSNKSQNEDDKCPNTENDDVSTSVHEHSPVLESSKDESSSCDKNADGQMKPQEQNSSDKISEDEKIPKNSASGIEKSSVLEKNTDQVEVSEVPNTQPTNSHQSNKRKRSSASDNSDEIEEINPLQKKLVKVVNIDDIKNKDLETGTVDADKEQSTNEKSILANRLSTGKSSEVHSQNGSLEKQQACEKPCLLEHECTNGNDLSSIVIKSELSSDEEPSDNEYMELKRKYLSALDLNESEKNSDKPKQTEIRTRSKADEKKFKVVDNLSKVIDEVATHYSAEHANEEIKLPSATANAIKRREIFIKPLSKMQMPKQRARKSFPMSISSIKNVYTGVKKDNLKQIAKCTSIAVINTPPVKNNSANKACETLSTGTGNIMFLTPTPAASNSITILPPNQPITYTTNVGNPMLTMVQHPIGTALNNVYIQSTTLTPPVTTSNSVVNHSETTENIESQNYIPQSGAPSKTLTIASSNKTSTTNSDNVTSTVNISTISLTPVGTSTTTSASNANSSEVSVRPNDIIDEIQTLSSFVPESLTKAISEIMCRAPPKLKPRPPGPLSAQFDEGLPSAAGTVTSRVNSISHRLGDYFRGMLIELLQEMGNSSNPEAEITRLRLENEELKHKHAEEILEVKKNISSILKDIQKSLADERSRLIDETRSACETECLKRVEEAKSKQWCASCSKEAQFYCCWNTSYCDYPCQQKHWPKHMSKCTQNIQNAQQLQTTNATNTPKSQAQPLVLRQTTAPKGFAKALIAKPTKVFVNRSGSSKGPFNVVRTTSGSHITLVEATPGNYELLGNGGPISIGGKFISSVGKIKSGNVISVTSPSSSGSTIVTGSGQKAIVIAQSKQPPATAPQPTITTTIVSDDECD